MEVSAKNNENAESIFFQCAKLLYNDNLNENSSLKSSNIKQIRHLKNGNENKKKCGC